MINYFDLLVFVFQFDFGSEVDRTAIALVLLRRLGHQRETQGLIRRGCPQVNFSHTQDLSTCYRRRARVRGNLEMGAPPVALAGRWLQESSHQLLGRMSGRGEVRSGSGIDGRGSGRRGRGSSDDRGSFAFAVLVAAISALVRWSLVGCVLLQMLHFAHQRRSVDVPSLFLKVRFSLSPSLGGLRSPVFSALSGSFVGARVGQSLLKCPSCPQLWHLYAFSGGRLATKADCLAALRLEAAPHDPLTSFLTEIYNKIKPHYILVDVHGIPREDTTPRNFQPRCPNFVMMRIISL